MHPITVAILVTLFAATTIYALVLEHLHERYVPDWTWLTVVGGNTMIGLALLAIETLAQPLTFALVLAANVVAGAPIIIWQIIQNERRRRERGR